MARSYQLGPLRRAVNAVMRTLIRLGVGGRTTYLLTTTGRKSGQPRTTPVTLVENGERWLVSPYGDVAWVHNIRAHPDVMLQRGRHQFALRASEADATEAGPVLQRYVHKVRITAPYFDARPDDPVESFVAEAARHPVFRLVAATG
jgi:deazaflavin-dependent oxidoreductase (nitroreductase family)